MCKSSITKLNIEFVYEKKLKNFLNKIDKTSNLTANLSFVLHLFKKITRSLTSETEYTFT